MRILLTGGSGFIGKSIYNQLKDKYTFYNPSHQELSIEDIKKTNSFFIKNKIDVIIHSAVSLGENSLEINLRMLMNLLKNLNQFKKMIVFGSGAEYAKTRHLNKIKETEFGVQIPQDIYGFAKYISSLLTKNEKKVLTLRLFGIYGEMENYRFKFITNSIVKNLLGMPIRIKQNVIFDYLYISDLVKIVDFFLTHNSQYNVYNISPTQSISLLKIAKLINKYSNKKSKIEIINPGMNFKYTGDNRRLLKTNRSLKFTSYEQGIKKLLSYYSKNIDKLDKDAIIKDEFLSRSKIKK